MPMWYKQRKESGEYDRKVIERRNAERKRYYDKTSYAPNHGNRWSEEEINMVLRHEMRDMELSKILGRSVRAIQIIRNKKGRTKNGTDD